MWCSMNNFVRILFFLGWRGFGKGDGLLLEETDRRKGEKKGPPQGGGGTNSRMGKSIDSGLLSQPCNQD